MVWAGPAWQQAAWLTGGFVALLWALEIFDAVTGAIVKRGSVIATASVDTPQATWLPGGRYVYLDDRTLWMSSEVPNG